MIVIKTNVTPASKNSKENLDKSKKRILDLEKFELEIKIHLLTQQKISEPQSNPLHKNIGCLIGNILHSLRNLDGSPYYDRPY